MDVGKGIMGAAMQYARGDVMGMAKGLLSTFKTASNGSSAEQRTIETRSSGADVIMLSGWCVWLVSINSIRLHLTKPEYCHYSKDSQTSADATEAGKATGAMSWAFIQVSNLIWLSWDYSDTYPLPLHSSWQVMTTMSQLSYQGLLCATRDLLAQKYSQKPQ